MWGRDNDAVGPRSLLWSIAGLLRGFGQIAFQFLGIGFSASKRGMMPSASSEKHSEMDVTKH